MTNVSQTKVYSKIYESIGQNRRTSTEANRLRWTLAIVLFAVLLNLSLVFTASDDVSNERRIVGSLALWVTVPPTIAFVRRPSFTLILSPLLMLLYLVYFVRSIFSSQYSVKYEFYSESQLVDAAWDCFLGVAGISFALTLALSRKVLQTLPRIAMPTSLGDSTDRLALISLISPMLRLVVRLALVPASASQPVNLLGAIAQCAGLVVLCDTFMNDRAWNWRPWLVVASLVLTAGVGVGSSLVTEPLLVFLVPLCAYISIRRKLPITVLVVVAVTFAPLLYVRSEYRQSFNWTHYDADSSARFIKFTYETIDAKGFDVSNLADSSQERVNMFGALTQVVAKSPGEVPLWHGETYLPALTAFVPRFLWPNKSVLDTGQQFGRRYNFLDEDDYVTSANMPHLVEMRANFGREWMFFGMLLIGGIQVLLWRLFDHPDSGPLLLGIGTTLMSNLLMIESSVSLSIAPAYIQTPFLVAGMWLLTGAGVKQFPRFVRGSSTELCQRE